MSKTTCPGIIYPEFIPYAQNLTGKSHQWSDVLYKSDRNDFVPFDALAHCFPSTVRKLPWILKQGTLVEIPQSLIHEHENNSDRWPPSSENRWFARISEVCGFYVLLKIDELRHNSIWIHMFSDKIRHLGSCETKYLAVQNVVKIRHVKEKRKESQSRSCALRKSYGLIKKTLATPSRFRIGQRLELVNYGRASEVRVAKIDAICGRRLKVSVKKEDYPRKLRSNDRQCARPGQEYWIDEDSFLILPVGFAAVNRLNLNATSEYKEHTMKIAACIEQGLPPVYNCDDVTFEQLEKTPVSEDVWKEIKVGQKFEILDPLVDDFTELRIGSVHRKCKTVGYIIVGIDGYPEEDAFPIHIKTCTFWYPIGFAHSAKLTVVPPDDFPENKEFNLEEYMEGSQLLPLHLVSQMPALEIRKMFRPGAWLEAADRSDNKFIWPARVVSLHVRMIIVDFDGWGQEHRQLYDIESHELLPAGWCDFHSYPLQEPKRFDVVMPPSI